MKTTAKITALLLIIATLVFPVLTLCASAEETSSEDTGFDFDNYVFYTDLFWGYSSEYLKNAGINGNYKNLQAYSSETNDAIINAYNCYINDSPKYKWTVAKEAINIVTDPVKWVQVVSSDQGMDYTYNNALGAASERFAKSILAVPENMETGWERIEAGEKILDKTEKLFEVFDNLEGTYDLSKLTEKETYKAVFEAVKSSKVLKSLKVDQIDGVLKDVLDDPSGWAKTAGMASDIYGASKAIMMGLLFEDTRLEIIYGILAELPHDTMLYEGLNTFMNTIDGGFVDYFIHNYLVEELLKEVGEKVVKKLTSAVVGAPVISYEVVNSCLEIASFVVFDVVFNIPDLEELTELYILYHFTREMYDLIDDKFAKFDSSFNASDVLEFEVLMRTLFDLTNTALEIGEEMTDDCSKSGTEHHYYLKSTIMPKAKGAGYERYISNAKALILEKPKEERTLKEKLDLYYTSGMKFSGASDSVTKDTVYYFDHYLRANLTILGPTTMTVEEGKQILIDGNITLGKEYGGEMYWQPLCATLKNNGSLVCTGNFKVYYEGSNVGKYIQENENATLFVRGDADFTSNYYNETCKITAGKVILDGDKQQTLTGFSAHDVTVINPEGIKYASYAKITGHFDLNGYPLDCGEYYTAIYSTTTFADGSDYKELRIGDSTVRLGGKVKGNITVLGTNTLLIDENSSLIVEGNITVGREYQGENYSYPICATLRNDGILVCTGNLTVWANGYNEGTYVQSDSDARLYIEGNVDFGYYAYKTCKITAGKVTFNGGEQQSVNGLRAHDITVDNPKGIKYESYIEIAGHFDLKGNPLDCGEYYTGIYSTTTFADGSDYKELVLANQSVSLSGKVKGNITVLGANTLVVSENSVLIVDGNITVGKEYRGENYSSSIYATLRNNGTLVCTGNLTVHNGSSNEGRLVQSGSWARLYLEGDADFSSYPSQTCKITAGEVILSGQKLQTVKGLLSPTIILANMSVDGVVFASAIYPSMLFNHNGNKYTLYNNGAGSVFVDYDGDGMKDNTDPYPASVYNNGIFGDVNGDNVFSNADITLVIRMLSGWGMEDIPEYMADADTNKKYNNRDIIALIRKLAGWDF